MGHSLTAKEITYIAMGVALTAVCSWISVPALFTMVPFTMQTFSVCLVTALFGLRLGLWTVSVYILLGMVGVPVFAGFRGGPAVLLGPTGGYIVGFFFTAFVVGLTSDRQRRGTASLILGMVLGIALLYTFGTVWYVFVYTRKTGAIGVLAALAKCVFPYLIPDGIKIVLAAFLTVRLQGYVRKELRA